MKNIVKIFLVVIAINMATDELYAQNFGIKAGLNLSNMLFENNGGTYSDDFKINTGFHIGATAEFPLTEMFSLEAGLLLSTKGFKMIREKFRWDVYELKINLLYLDIPLLAKASFDLGSAKIYGVFGPYLGIGLSGKTQSKAGPNEEDSITSESDIKWGSNEDEDDLKRIDFGLTMGRG
jgi:hypothetical protein